MKKTLQDIELKSFQIKRLIFLKKEPDLVLSQEDTIADYLSLGTFCLHRSITGFIGNTITVRKRDFSNESKEGTAFIGDRCVELPANPFSAVACKYIESIANYIAGQKYFNNMILGAELSMFLSLYCAGENVMFSPNPREEYNFSQLLPGHWDMTDTVEAQRVAFTLIEKAFEVCVEPFGF